MKRAPGLPSGKLGMGLAMVNMGNDGKVADVLVLHVHFPFNIHVVLIENIIPFPRLLLQEKQRNGCFFI